jgi:citrate lyase subunit beta/citryl-CoA lyase
LEAAASGGGGAVALDGKMIDAPVIRRAELILGDASSKGGRSTQ